MNDELRFHAVGDEAFELRWRDRSLMRYVYRPETPLRESTRPYAHPIHTLAGVLVTNHRPNDHPWHHGLNFTITGISGYNFWGGGTYRKGEGYQWRNDHGTQQHARWLETPDERIVEGLDWRVGTDGPVLLREQRTLTPSMESEKSWSLRWQSALRNDSGRPLALGNYHSAENLLGSHYTGLQFRGARDLLDDHGDPEIGIWAAGELSGEKTVHGAAAPWMEWRCQQDGTLRRLSIRFENNQGDLHWFVRRNNPLAAFPFQFDRDLLLVPGDVLKVDHTLVFTDE